MGGPAGYDGGPGGIGAKGSAVTYFRPLAHWVYTLGDVYRACAGGRKEPEGGKESATDFHKVSIRVVASLSESFT